MFWKFVLASFASALVALLRPSWKWMLVRMVLVSPVAWYLNATPRFKGIRFILLLHLVAAYLLRRRQRVMAGLLVLPSVALSIFVALLVIFQSVPAIP